MAGKTKAAELVAFVEGKLGTPYVYGAKQTHDTGDPLSRSAYEYLRQAYPNYVHDSDAAKIGKVCVDCSGLISWCTHLLRGSSAYKATATKVLPISRISEAVPGCALWKQGHIGVYIGGGWCIEARGSAYGTVKTRVADRPWTHILWLLDIDYTKAEAATVAEKKSAQEWANRYLKAEILAGKFAALTIDGALGPKSEAAFCRCLQKWLDDKKGARLAVDGDFGPLTKSAIKFRLQLGNSGIPVRVAQAMLMRNGYNPGECDGQLGEKTDAAVYAFKSDHKLPQVRIINADTFEALFA